LASPPSNNRILIVDDDQEFARSLNKTLLKEGYEVNITPEKAIADKLFSSDYFPLILLDFQIHNKHGLQLLKDIRTFSPKSRVIIFTVNDDTDMFKRAKSEGAYAILNKPVKRQTILRYARAALKRHYS